MSQEAESRTEEDTRIKEVPRRERSYKEEGCPKSREQPNGEGPRRKQRGNRTEERKPGKKDGPEEKRAPREAENRTGEE